MRVRRKIKKLITYILVVSFLVTCMPFIHLNNAEAGYVYKYVTDYRTSSSNSFPSQIYYSDSSGYSGYISKNGSSYVISGEAPQSIYYEHYYSYTLYSDETLSGWYKVVNRNGKVYKGVTDPVSVTRTHIEYLYEINGVKIYRDRAEGIWGGYLYTEDTRTWRQNYAGTVSKYIPDPVVLTSISVSPSSVNLDEGDTQQLTVKARYSDGSSKTKTSSASYSSNNTNVATVSSSGMITAKNAGSATVTVRYGGYTRYVSVNVDPVLTSISVSPSSVNLDEGDTQQLTVKARYSDGSSKTKTSSASYSSNNTNVATVSSSGMITAKNAGSATVTVRYGGYTRYVSVNVDPVLTSISVSPSPVNIRKGDTKQLSVTARFSDSSSESITTKATYSSDNPSIATVSSTGLITGKAIGVTTVRVTYSGKSQSVTVNVREPDLVMLSVNPDSINIRRGDTNQLIATARYSDGSFKNVTSKATYTSRNTSIATVSNTGLVRGVTKGSTTITVGYENKSVNVSVEVRARLYIYIRTLK
jgi:uncharacterized protein YjdB